MLKYARLLSLACGCLIASAHAAGELPLIDISGETNRHSIVAAGTAELYQGHPTTLLSDDGKRLFCVWTIDHGGKCGPAAESLDGGRTWSRVDGRFPEIYREDHFCCPTLQKLLRPDGGERWLVFTRRGPWSRKTRRTFGRLGVMASDDCGGTWRELGPFDVPTSMPPTGWLRLKDGSYALFGQYYVMPEDPKAIPKEEFVWMSVTRDGGESWSPIRKIARQKGKWLCEPFAVRSPDGMEIAVLLRENNHKGNSMVVFSRDEGKTWTEPVETCRGLTGDRHQAVALPDGRLFVAFRDMAPESSTKGHFVAWVGPYDAIKSCDAKGAYRVKLLHNYAGMDCGYSGVELLPDGTILATTYIKYWNDNRRHSVVSVSVRPEYLDGLARATDTWYGFSRRVFEFRGQEAWIVNPKTEAEGRPWAWIMEWPGAFAKRTGSVALLAAGYHVVTLRSGFYKNGKFVSMPGNMNNARLRESREFQKHLVDELHFAPKANLIGMSWGGFYSVRYAGTYPEAVAHIYLDAPLLDFSTLSGKERELWDLNAKYGVDIKTYAGRDDPRQPVNMYEPIAKAGIPVLLLYGGSDATVPPSGNCLRFAESFKSAGGDIEIVAREHYGHHPHGLEIDEQQKFVDFFNGKKTK